MDNESQSSSSLPSASAPPVVTPLPGLVTPEQYRTADRLLTREGVTAMGMGALAGGPFLAAFALALGATNAQVGMLATIALVSQLMQLPGLALVRYFPRRRFIVAALAGISRLCWLPIALVPLFAGGPRALLAGFAAAALSGAILGPAWNSLLRDIIPRDTFNFLMARRQAYGMALTLTLTLLGGWFVDFWKSLCPGQEAASYSLLFVLGTGFGMVGVYAISRLPCPPMAANPHASLARLLTTPLRDRNFRHLLSFMGLWSFAVNMAGPFFVIYMLQRLQISFTLVTILTVMSQVAYLLFLRLWGRLADRFSSKSVLSVSGTLFLLTILGWTFTTMPERFPLTVPLLIVIHLVSGMALAGVNLASSSIGLKLAPDEAVHSYMTVFALISAASGALGPLAGGLLGDIGALRELALSLSWTDPTHHMEVYALSIKAMDFVFLAAFLVGLAAMRRLARVEEVGEVPRDRVVHELVDQMVLPFKMISSVEGLRSRLALPVGIIVRLVNRRRVVQPESTIPA